MGQQIVKQPNGLYAVWSSVVDDFVLFDATPDDIVNEMVNTERKNISESVRRIIGQLAANDKPYCQFTMSWRECLATIKRLHGKDAESLKMIAGKT